MSIWIILGVVSIAFLAMSFFRGRNAIWGGLTIGVLVGIILVIVNRLSGHNSNWLIIAEGAIIGVLIGSAFELISRIIKK